MEKVDLKTKAVAVYDYGLFVELAARLARDFGKVYYYSPWKSSFPTSNLALVGKGLPDVERVENFWDIKEDCDLFVFPDVYDGDIQMELESQGYAVWGARKGEEMELDRVGMMEWMKKAGLPIPNYTVVTGLPDLRKYLKSNKDVWVKVSKYRGDFETFKSEDYDLSEPKLDELEWKLGAKKYWEEFVVVQSLDNCVEIGYDGYTVDGQFPGSAICGIEIKDLGYVAMFKEYDKFAKEVKDFNTAIAPLLKKYNYKGFFSTELRVDKKRDAYMIDFCAREGSPPSELYQEMFSNLSEVIWHGAHGVMVDPISDFAYSAEILLHSQWADKNWQAVDFPRELRDKIKFRNLTVYKDKYYIVPQSVGLPEIGAVVGFGETLDAAIDDAKSVGEQVKGYFIDVPDNALDKAVEELDKCKEFGINLFE